MTDTIDGTPRIEVNEKDTLADRIYHDIKRRILEGGIASGESLSENQLAAEAGASRTPLRVALARLEQEGVIARLANGTLAVQPVTVEQLLNIVQLRRLLEGAAAARAAEMARSTGLHPALAAVKEVTETYANGKATAFDEFWKHDDAFHTAVAHAAGLTLWPAMLSELRETARRCTITRTHDRFTEQAKEHLAVIAAIEAGDAHSARAAMETHFASVRTRFLDWLARP
ncbi:GntR family transcriptional regulator [Rhizobium sp. CG5]|uniref:GntR family transcriptional regulator n=1 Tax=Rhizobium sp. CG5 TaxID=2726076 RepID=UPI00203328FB|nr:GntR family transcriptional regulator [Rhizobium sp. CG5]MCM2477067.1 GntR family transcriptional regulator [Rhizobium sp. CG5]